MNDFYISITGDGTKKYPLHQHPKWEIMYYLHGTGYLDTENGQIPFEPGHIIIVPPRKVHGSVSENGFINISVGGDFGHLFLFDQIVVQRDNTERSGKRLATLIFDSRHTNDDYLLALCNAYAQFLLQNSKLEKRITQAIRDIIQQVSIHFSDSSFEITSLLNQSGYAEDYIRAEFKRVTMLSPVDFLAKMRVEHARNLFEIYGKSLFVSEVAEACGFDDPVYFSRRFKQFIGISPVEYRNQMAKK